MTQYKQPYLEPYKGPATRHTCPACGRKHSFTLYIDPATGLPINEKVGKCNRIIKCGYHYTPKQFFLENPKPIINHVNQYYKPKPPKPPGTIPFSFVEKSASYKSNFVRFLCEFMNEQQISTIGDNYALGATKNKEVIFWQIDVFSKIRTGKIMQYNPETGRRIKHENGSIDWAHNKLKHSGQLPESFNLQQCFFGEHLLKLYPSKTVAIVESEKTACIASVYFPELVWLAAGCLNGLSVDKCQVLKGRDVILFPDLKAFDAWKEKATLIQQECDCQIEVSNLLERIASEQEKQDGFDIADYIIQQFRQKSQQETFDNAFTPLLNQMIQSNPAMLTLIQNLDLEEI